MISRYDLRSVAILVAEIVLFSRVKYSGPIPFSSNWFIKRRPTQIDILTLDDQILRYHTVLFILLFISEFPP